ncbi:hypothetical protein TrRE_jg7431, partial [Triparma retinervis]
MDASESLSVSKSISKSISKSRKKNKGKKFIPKTPYSDASSSVGSACSSDEETVFARGPVDGDIYTFDMLDTAGTRALYDQVTFLTTPPSNSLHDLCGLLCGRGADVFNGGLLPAVLAHIYTYQRDVEEGE